MSAAFLSSIKAFGSELLEKMEELLPKENGEANDSLKSAMRYTIFAPSKCIRPFIFKHCVGIFLAHSDSALDLAGAIELIHVYTIVHDDMACMDNEKIRRGITSLHLAYGEAMALLAGNALLLLAFRIISSASDDPRVLCSIVNLFSDAIGYAGVIGGQSIDISQHFSGVGDILTIHEMKTAAFFSAVCVAGGIVGRASEIDLKKLSEYGRKLGLAFQIKDDINDVGSPEKNNLAKLIGIEEAAARAEEFLDDATHALNMLPGNKNALYSVIDFVKDY